MPREEPRDPRQYGMAPSARAAGETVGSEPGVREMVEGRRGEYRVVFKAMRIPGLPSDISIGNATINQTEGPIWTQRTTIRQSPGWRPIYEKRMARLPVGEGETLTACVLQVTVPSDLIRAMELWHQEALAAIAVLVALFDERVAQEMIAADLVIYDRDGTRGEKAADSVLRMRQFPPTSRVSRSDRRSLDVLAALPPTSGTPTVAAARWYLRAAQAGPTPDAIIFLWTALEALSKPPYGARLTGSQSRLSDVAWIENALRGPRHVLRQTGRTDIVRNRTN
jgi:hypothetical protein